MLLIRRFRNGDLEEVINLFKQTVKNINIQDYEDNQIQAWLSNLDYVKWQESLLNHISFLAFINNELVGFADMTEDGYLDRLYVSYKYQKQGIASKLLNKLEKEVKVKTYTTFSSITAKNFFLKKGYTVVYENHVTRNGIILTNYYMKKTV